MTAKTISNLSASVRARLQNHARTTKRLFQEMLQYYAMERFFLSKNVIQLKTKSIFIYRVGRKMWGLNMGSDFRLFSRCSILLASFLFAGVGCLPSGGDELVAEGAAQETCQNELDDDNDGLIDCEDEGCQGSEKCKLTTSDAGPNADAGLDAGTGECPVGSVSDGEGVCTVQRPTIQQASFVEFEVDSPSCDSQYPSSTIISVAASGPVRLVEMFLIDGDQRLGPISFPPDFGTNVSFSYDICISDIRAMLGGQIGVLIVDERGEETEPRFIQLPGDAANPNSTSPIVSSFAVYPTLQGDIWEAIVEGRALQTQAVYGVGLSYDENDMVLDSFVTSFELIRQASGSFVATGYWSLMSSVRRIELFLVDLKGNESSLYAFEISENIEDDFGDTQSPTQIVPPFTSPIQLVAGDIDCVGFMVNQTSRVSIELSRVAGSDCDNSRDTVTELYVDGQLRLQADDDGDNRCADISSVVVQGGSDAMACVRGFMPTNTLLDGWLTVAATPIECPSGQFANELGQCELRPPEISRVDFVEYRLFDPVCPNPSTPHGITFRISATTFAPLAAFAINVAGYSLEEVAVPNGPTGEFSFESGYCTGVIEQQFGVPVGVTLRDDRGLASSTFVLEMPGAEARAQPGAPRPTIMTAVSSAYPGGITLDMSGESLQGQQLYAILDLQNAAGMLFDPIRLGVQPDLQGGGSFHASLQFEVDASTSGIRLFIMDTYGRSSDWYELPLLCEAVLHDGGDGSCVFSDECANGLFLQPDGTCGCFDGEPRLSDGSCPVPTCTPTRLGLVPACGPKVVWDEENEGSNGSLWSADLLRPGVPMVARLSNAGDEDYFRFRVPPDANEGIARLLFASDGGRDGGCLGLTRIEVTNETTGQTLSAGTVSGKYEYRVGGAWPNVGLRVRIAPFSSSTFCRDRYYLRIQMADEPWRSRRDDGDPTVESRELYLGYLANANDEDVISLQVDDVFSPQKVRFVKAQANGNFDFDGSYMVSIETPSGVNIVSKSFDYSGDLIFDPTERVGTYIMRVKPDSLFSSGLYQIELNGEDDCIDYNGCPSELACIDGVWAANCHPDLDLDGVADIVDLDIDGDGVANLMDCFPSSFNQNCAAGYLCENPCGSMCPGESTQYECLSDFDQDGIADEFDDDADGDGVSNDRDCDPFNSDIDSRYHGGGPQGICVLFGTCSPGYHDGGDGSCVMLGECAASYHDGGDGQCVSQEICSDGYHDSGVGVCVELGVCADNYFVGATGVCGCYRDAPPLPNGTCAVPACEPELMGIVSTCGPKVLWAEENDSANNSTSGADVLQPGVPMVGRLGSTSDVDYYRFVVPAMQTGQQARILFAEDGQHNGCIGNWSVEVSNASTGQVLSGRNLSYAFAYDVAGAFAGVELRIRVRQTTAIMHCRERYYLRAQIGDETWRSRRGDADPTVVVSEVYLGYLENNTDEDVITLQVADATLPQAVHFLKAPNLVSSDYDGQYTVTVKAPSGAVITTEVIEGSGGFNFIAGEGGGAYKAHVTSPNTFTSGMYQLEFNGQDDCTESTCSDDPPDVVLGGYTHLLAPDNLFESCTEPERVASRFVVGQNPVEMSRLSFFAKGSQFSATVGIYTDAYVGSTNTGNGRGPSALVAESIVAETNGSLTEFTKYSVDLPLSLSANTSYWVVFDRSGGAQFANGQNSFWNVLSNSITPQTRLLQYTGSGPWTNCSSQGFLPYTLTFDPPPESCVDETWAGICVP